MNPAMEHPRPQGVRIRHAVKPRRWWQRWPLVVAMLFVVPVAVYLVAAPKAVAAEYTGVRYVITTTVSWVGAECALLREPVDGSVTDTIACDASGTAVVTVVAESGDWIGVDPYEVGGVWYGCSLSINGFKVLSGSGYAGVNCLQVL